MHCGECRRHGSGIVESTCWTMCTTIIVKSVALVEVVVVVGGVHHFGSIGQPWFRGNDGGESITVAAIVLDAR